MLLNSKDEYLMNRHLKKPIIVANNGSKRYGPTQLKIPLFNFICLFLCGYLGAAISTIGLLSRANLFPDES